MRTLNTRSIETAEAISKREVFRTHGALRTYAGPQGSGRLAGEDLLAYDQHRSSICYAVYSYATPIAWETLDGRVHIVSQRFSITTTRHQGNLYRFTERSAKAVA